ncbi:MAG: 30S ribosomal protein S17 [Candidatus Methylarchaceae archaeon HK01M]|nr:30S ribosomal protein S17 [Candidatus Methylarchaceae archaeon HK01M]
MEDLKIDWGGLNENMKNIGIDVKPPTKSCDDGFCPFHGSLGIRGKLLKGKAVSIKAKDMVIVEREYLQDIKKYMMYEKRRSRIPAHLPPCLGVNEGDSVIIAECRPLSKTVAFVVIEKLGE